MYDDYTRKLPTYTPAPPPEKSVPLTVLKHVGWFLYAVLATILTLGIFLRFHLLTLRLRPQELGGVRAGFYGCTHVYRENAGISRSDFLVVSTWHGKSRYPVAHISHAQTGIFNVNVQSSGGRTAHLGTWETRRVAAFVNNQVAE